MPRNLAARIPPDARMTGERIGELLGETPELPFREAVIKPGTNLNAPTPAGRERVAVLVDLLWLDARDANAKDRDVERHLREAEIWACHRATQLLDEKQRPPENMLIGADHRHIDVALATLEQLRAAIEAVGDTGLFPVDAPPLHTMPRNRKGNQWPGYAVPLAVEFIKAMEEANPGKEIGIGKQGPVTRFIAKIMRFITGEQPKLGAIEKHLREHLDR